MTTGLPYSEWFRVSTTRMPWRLIVAWDHITGTEPRE